MRQIDCIFNFQFFFSLNAILCVLVLVSAMGKPRRDIRLLTRGMISYKMINSPKIRELIGW